MYHNGEDQIYVTAILLVSRQIFYPKTTGIRLWAEFQIVKNSNYSLHIF